MQALDIAQGLEYLHGEGIIHGDLKGVGVTVLFVLGVSDCDVDQLNILISQSERACLADFGLATARDSKSIAMTYMTTHKATGTLRWQAPELFPDMGNQEADNNEGHNTTASDVYAYGLVCHEVNQDIEDRFFYVTERAWQMFSEDYPFPDISSDFQVMYAVKRGRRPTRPTKKKSQTRGLNDDVWNIIEACWNQDPNMRPSASKVVEYLRGLPNRPDDHRPLNDLDRALPPQVLSTGDRVDHPFSKLGPRSDDTDKLRELKWVSREIGA
jgi:serine/threonine protein kinase